MKETVACLSPEVTAVIVGAAGTLAGVRKLLYGPDPARFVAFTENVYWIPSVRPVMNMIVLVPLATTVELAKRTPKQESCQYQ